MDRERTIGCLGGVQPGRLHEDIRLSRTRHQVAECRTVSGELSGRNGADLNSSAFGHTMPRSSSERRVV